MERLHREIPRITAASPLAVGVARRFVPDRFTAARLLRSAATDHMRARGGHIDIGGPDSPIARIVVARGGEDDHTGRCRRLSRVLHFLDVVAMILLSEPSPRGLIIAPGDRE